MFTTRNQALITMTRFAQPTPEGHEDCEEDGGLVVEEVHDPGVEAGLVEGPVVAEVVARRADGHVGGGTDVLAERH